MKVTKRPGTARVREPIEEGTCGRPRLCSQRSRAEGPGPVLRPGLRTAPLRAAAPARRSPVPAAPSRGVTPGPRPREPGAAAALTPRLGARRPARPRSPARPRPSPASWVTKASATSDMSRREGGRAEGTHRNWAPRRRRGSDCIRGRGGARGSPARGAQRRAGRAGALGMLPGESPSTPAWQRQSLPSVIPARGQSPGSSRRGAACSASAPLAWTWGTRERNPKCFPKRLGDSRLEIKGVALFSSSQVGSLNSRRQTLLFRTYSLPWSNHKFIDLNAVIQRLLKCWKML